ISYKNFKRAVFLGSGPLYGTAVESALKLQELSNGAIMCNSDTFLGFRHGPRVVINEETLIIYLFSNNSYVRQYEFDLVKSMNKGNSGLFHLGVSEGRVNVERLDYQINLALPKQYLNEFFQPLVYIIPGQLLGFFKSIQLGLKPDNPSENGTISRVVQ